MAEAELFDGFAAALLDPERPVPPGLLTRPGADPGRRFAVYRNNVAAGLVEALRDTFPVTERIVGEAFFRAMAQAFVADRKPGSPLMVEYGGTFPDFVAGFPPAGSVPYLAGVAALEVACLQSLHAAEGPVLDAGALAARLADGQGDALLATRTVPHPAASVVTSAFPIVSIWAAHQDTESRPAFSGPWQPEAALVVRPGAEVQVRSLEAVAGAFAAALLAGDSVGDAGAAALEADAGFDVGGAFVALAEAGTIADLKGKSR